MILLLTSRTKVLLPTVSAKRQIALARYTLRSLEDLIAPAPTLQESCY